ncbi:endolytic transglycosylase MltG [Deltaproteobacteria bacterium TL4]
MRRFLHWKAGIALGIPIMILLMTGVHLLSYLRAPLNPNLPQDVIIAIPPGASFNKILHILEDHQLIVHPSLFQMIALFRGDASRIKAGEFSIDPHWTPEQLLEHLIAGKNCLYKVTVPEGWSYEEIVDRLLSKGLGTKKRYLELFTDPEFLAKTGWSNVPSLEGLLFPETYHFAKHHTEENILLAMVNELNKHLGPEYRERSKELNMSDYQILILASIVEKETGQEQDRPLIAAVFHNRLKKKMRLDSDPTVIYGLKNFDGDLTRRHLKTYSLYNTYKFNGLPPSPIASPGKASIYSTLYPAKVNYLFFVARGDGSSNFSSDLRSHNRAVWRYQLKNEPKPQQKKIKIQKEKDAHL